MTDARLLRAFYPVHLSCPCTEVLQHFMSHQGTSLP